MLNEYHLSFPRHLNESDARYLVIGGQARRLLTGAPTSDLDIWIDFEEINRDKFAVAFFKWIQRHPNHSGLRLVAPPTASIKQNTQLHLPDADVYFAKTDGDHLRLNEENKIDILFSLEACSPPKSSFEKAAQSATAEIVKDCGEVRFLPTEA